MFMFPDYNRSSSAHNLISRTHIEQAHTYVYVPNLGKTVTVPRWRNWYVRNVRLGITALVLRRWRLVNADVGCCNNNNNNNNNNKLFYLALQPSAGYGLLVHEIS
jgi:hypothetical protein